MPWIGPVIGAAGSLLGGLFGGGRPGLSQAGQTAQNNLLGYSNAGMQANNNLQGQLAQWAPYTNFGSINSWYPYVQTGLQNAEQNTQTGQGFLSNAQSAFKPAQDYWSSILAGGPQATQALSPQIQQIQQQYQAARSGLSNFAPMGGGRASTLSQIPFQKAGAIGNLYAGLAPQAATALGNLGQQMGGLGSTLTGQGTGLTGSALGSLSGLSGGLAGNVLNSWLGLSGQGIPASNTVLGTDLQLQGIGANNGAMLGGGIGNILGSVPWGNIFGGGRSPANVAGGGFGNNPGYGGSVAGTA